MNATHDTRDTNVKFNSHLNTNVELGASEGELTDVKITNYTAAASRDDPRD